MTLIRGIKVGYRVLGRREDVLQGYLPRVGLEGPYPYAGGRVLYYDPREGRYWDPRTDFYVEQDEMDMLHTAALELLK